MFVVRAGQGGLERDSIRVPSKIATSFVQDEAGERDTSNPLKTCSCKASAQELGRGTAFRVYGIDGRISLATNPTGKGGANAMSDPNRMAFTTRTRVTRIFDLRPTSAQSQTTQYSRDHRSFDRGLDRVVAGFLGLKDRTIATPGPVSRRLPERR